MTIHIKYFASLRERMGRGDDAVDSTGVKTVGDVWAQVSGNKPLPVNTLIAVNMEYADLSHVVQEGDEVAFFPPVTGG